MVTSFGYFLYPPAWLGESPLDGTPQDLRSTWDPVTAATLPEGVEARCFRNGLFTFDLRQWHKGAPASDEEAQDIPTMHEWVRWRSTLLNAHLACLFTAWKRIDGKTRVPMVVTPAELIRVQDNGGMSVTNAPEVGELLRADWTSLDEPSPSDWRLHRSDIVSQRAIDESFDLLRELLGDPDGEHLRLSELMLRSVVAHGSQNFDASLIQSWAITEKLLTTLWERYIAKNREREIDGQLQAFINGERKKFLTGRDLPISVISEFLSLLGCLPHELFERLAQVRRARNRWMHSLDPITLEESSASAGLALDLLTFVHGVDLDPAPDVMLLSGV